MPTLRQAIGYWLKLGFISFGEPTGQISIMHRELVEKRLWMSKSLREELLLRQPLAARQ